MARGALACTTAPRSRRLCLQLVIILHSLLTVVQSLGTACPTRCSLPLPGGHGSRGVACSTRAKQQTRPDFMKPRHAGPGDLIQSGWYTPARRGFMGPRRGRFDPTPRPQSGSAFLPSLLAAFSHVLSCLDRAKFLGHTHRRLESFKSTNGQV